MAAHRQGATLSLLDGGGERVHSAQFKTLWPQAIEWTAPFYDGEHLRWTVIWLLRLDPAATEPLLVAALTHDMERHFPGGTQPDKAAGLWDDVDYNTRHAERSAQIVSAWLRTQGMPESFVSQVIPAILEHEFGGSQTGNLMQAADSLSFLDVNAPLVARWVNGGETSLAHGLRKLEWMYERIQIERARELARPLYEEGVAMVARGVERTANR